MRSKEEIEAVIKHLQRMSGHQFSEGNFADGIAIAAVYDALEWAAGSDTSAFALEVGNKFSAAARAQRQ